MTNYDFLILQPNEFECLTRDLLQKKESVFVESFTPGKDGGVDLRFAKVKGQNAIVQVKRYKDYNSLKSNLTKEIIKVKVLKPDRYIISTSVGLTPDNKSEILNLFAPYIQSTGDILRKDDLNNLLGQYPEVEKQYYKLWLGSTAVLEDILNKRINNWSAIEMEKIRREVTTYVMNDSFNDAKKILSENRYVIISGIPGIGKTTLSRMLVNYLLGEGYEEFVMLESIGDAAQKLTAGTKQVFFFDDFLGATSFQNDEKGFDRKLVIFIDKIKHEQDKLFILATREYILQQAKQTYEVISTNNLELAKCILDLSNYTESIRAKILYNHLAMAELPLPYVRVLLEKQSYMNIIKHNNFNPRIIETFLNAKLYQKVEPKEFVAKFEDFFDQPYSVWDLAFGKLDAIAQYALVIRMTMGYGNVFLSDWYNAMKHFVQGTYYELHLEINEVVWRNLLKIIEGTFVISYPSREDYVVKYMNPSVYDFLAAWLRSYREIQETVIRESLFVEQLYTPFSDVGYPSFVGYGRIELHQSLYPVMETAYRKHLTDIHSCRLKEYGQKDQKEPMNTVEFLLKMEGSFGQWFKKNTVLMAEIVTQDLIEDSSIALFKRMDLLDKLGDEAKAYLDLEHLSEVVLDEAEHLDDFVNIMDLLSSTEFGNTILASDGFHDKVEMVLEEELKEADTMKECEHIDECLDELLKNIPTLDESAWKGAISEVMSKIPDGPDYSDDFSRDFNTGEPDTVEYEEMFTSLLETARE
jgi:tRNA uridine 5-carbamoylmethylation protein Kti12